MEKIGTVCFSDDDIVSFWLETKSVCYGELMRIPSEEVVYYARVFHSESGTTLDTESQLIYSAGKEDFGPYSTFRRISAQLFLEREGDKIRTPTLNPPYGSHVFRLTDEDQAYMHLAGVIIIGRLRVGKELSAIIGLNIAFIDHNSCITGKVGSGKTNAELQMNACIILSDGAVALIFDFAGELWEGKGLGAGLKDLPYNNVHYYSPTQKGKQRLVLGLNSLYPSNLKRIFPDITIHQKRLAERLFKGIGKDWIIKSINAYEEGDSTDVADLASGSGKGRKMVIDALMLKIMSLEKGQGLWEVSDKNFINYIISDLYTGVSCLVDVSDLPDDKRNSIVEMTAERAANFWKKKWEEKPHDYWKNLPALLITLEEAHQFLHKPSKEHQKTFFSEIALRYRKYKVGLCAVTPRPSLIDEDVFAMLWTKITMKTDLKKDRRYITDNTPFLEYSDKELKMLDLGEALLVSEPQLRFAVPIKITYYPDYLKQIIMNGDFETLKKDFE